MAGMKSPYKEVGLNCSIARKGKAKRKTEDILGLYKGNSLEYAYKKLKVKGYDNSWKFKK